MLELWRWCRKLLCLLLWLSAGTATAQSDAFDAGNYSLKGRDGRPQVFSVEKSGDKWLIKSSDPDFMMLKVVCASGCDYLPMAEERTHPLLPAQFRQNLDISCIANVGFALCRLTSKLLPECRNAKAGEACRIGPPNAPGKPMYAMFPLFAPVAAPVNLTRLDGP